jgi:hypothetical protein
VNERRNPTRLRYSVGRQKLSAFPPESAFTFLAFLRRAQSILN